MSEPKLKKNSFIDYYFSKNRTPLFFYVGMIVSWLVYFGYSFFQRDAYYRIMLFDSGSDTFMDFFNSCRDAAQGFGVYTDRYVIYPPMANLMYRFCNLFITDAYLNTENIDKFKILSTPSNIFIYVILAVLCVSLILSIYKEKLEGSKLFKTITSIMFCMSFPFLYAIERGNNIIIAYLLVLVFVFFHDSENKWVSEFSCLCLAFAASIKMYPALFGLILVLAKRYKQAIRTVVYGILMFVLPFGAYRWMEGFNVWIANIVEFSNRHSVLTNYSGVTSVKTSAIITIYKLTGKFGLPSAVDKIFDLLIVVILFLAVIFLKKKYQKYIAFFVLMDCMPGAGGAYTFMFLTIPLIYLFNEKKIRLYDYLYFFVILAMFMPYALPLKFETGYVSVNYGVEGIAMLLLFILVVIDLGMHFYGVRKAKGAGKGKSKVAAKVATMVIVMILSVSVFESLYSDRKVMADTRKIIGYSHTITLDGVTYDVKTVDDADIPYGFYRSDFEYDGNTYDILIRKIGQAGQYGYIYLFYADDGSGYKFYRFDSAIESFEPYIYFVYNGIQYPILNARLQSLGNSFPFYEIAHTEFFGVDRTIITYNYQPDWNGFEEKNRNLVCLLTEDNRVAFYSYVMKDGVEADLEVYSYIEVYPTPYPAAIANHTLAKKLPWSAEKITMLCMASVFIPTILIASGYIFIQYRREKDVA